MILLLFCFVYTIIILLYYIITLYVPTIVAALLFVTGRGETKSGGCPSAHGSRVTGFVFVGLRVAVAVVVVDVVVVTTGGARRMWMCVDHLDPVEREKYKKYVEFTHRER